MSLTLALIVKNEARMLPELLETHRGLADEVLVVDTGSTDGTPELARARGARVDAVAWPGSYAAARNAAIQRCATEWILMMDADERLDPGDQARLRDHLGPGAPDAWRLVQRTYTDDVELLGFRACGGRREARGRAGAIDVRLARLFRRRPELAFEGIIHELLEPSVERAGLGLRDSTLVLHHYKEDQSEDRKAEKGRLYLDLSRRKLELDPRDPQARLELAMAAIAMERFEEAAAAIEPALAAVPGSVALAEHLAVALIRGRRPQAVEPALRRSVDALPARSAERGRLVALVGEALVEVGRLAEAIPMLEEGLRSEPGAFRPTVALGVAWLGLGQIDAAERALDRAARLCPSSDLPLLNLALCRARQGRPAEADALLRRAAALNPRRWQTHAHLAGLAFERGAYEEAAAHAARARAIPGCGADGYLRSCAAALALGRDAEALDHARVAARLDPRHEAVVASLL